MPFIICGSVLGCLWAHAAELRRPGRPLYVGVKRTPATRLAQRRPTRCHTLLRMLRLR